MKIFNGYNNYTFSNSYVWPVRGGSYFRDHRSVITNCSPFASGFVLEWAPEYGWDSVVKCSTDLVNMPFTDLSIALPYPVNSYTDSVINTKCFYRVDLQP